MTSFVQSLDLLLFNVAGTPITVATLLVITSVVVAAIVAARLGERALRRALSAGGRDSGTAAAIARLVHYVLLAVGVAIAIRTAGIDLGALFAASAIFAVGLGLAMQNIAQNFVAGVILLLERAIKPSDVLQVEGRIVKVIEMGIRATVVRSRDGEDLIVPNSVLIQSTVTNYTLRSSHFRVRGTVGVTYGSDLAVVRTTLEHVAHEITQKWGVSTEEPQVILTGFGDNAVLFEVAVWMQDPWRARPALSELYEAIWRAFKEAAIVIAFPQVDVHFDPALTEAWIDRPAKPAARS